MRRPLVQPVFGVVHLSNVISHGVAALSQAVIVSIAVLNGLFDFSLLTGSAILVNQTAYLGSGAAILVDVVLIVILLIRRRRIEPARES